MLGELPAALKRVHGNYFLADIVVGRYGAINWHQARPIRNEYHTHWLKCYHAAIDHVFA
jgi:hypothetical protein